MKLWKLEQSVNDGWDTFDSCIVAAETLGDARVIHPCSRHQAGDAECCDWASPSDVTATLIGEATEGTERGVILSSFNAG